MSGNVTDIKKPTELTAQDLAIRHNRARIAARRAEIKAEQEAAQQAAEAARLQAQKEECKRVIAEELRDKLKNPALVREVLSHYPLKDELGERIESAKLRGAYYNALFDVGNAEVALEALVLHFDRKYPDKKEANLIANPQKATLPADSQEAVIPASYDLIKTITYIHPEMVCRFEQTHNMLLPPGISELAKDNKKERAAVIARKTADIASLIKGKSLDVDLTGAALEGASQNFVERVPEPAVSHVARAQCDEMTAIIRPR